MKTNITSDIFEISKANVKLSTPIYQYLQLQSNKQGITISELLSKAISAYLPNDIEIFGNLAPDFCSRLKNHLQSLKGAKDFDLYIIHLKRLTNLETNSNLCMNKLDEIRKILDIIYFDLDNLSKRRLLKLLVFKEELFNSLLSCALNCSF